MDTAILTDNDPCSLGVANALQWRRGIELLGRNVDLERMVGAGMGLSSLVLVGRRMARYSRAPMGEAGVAWKTNRYRAYMARRYQNMWPS